MHDLEQHRRVRVVEMLDDGRFVDETGNEWNQLRALGDKLLPGHYVLTWTSAADLPQFGVDVELHGPYARALLARLKASHESSPDR